MARQVGAVVSPFRSASVQVGASLRVAWLRILWRDRYGTRAAIVQVPVVDVRTDGIPQVRLGLKWCRLHKTPHVGMCKTTVQFCASPQIVSTANLETIQQTAVMPLYAPSLAVKPSGVCNGRLRLYTPTTRLD
jgi:hypothetical protein